MLYLHLFLTRPKQQEIQTAPAAMAATTRASPLLISLLIIIELTLLFHLPDRTTALANAQPPEHQQQQHRQQQQPAQLVQSTCNSTSYYDVCIAALAADPSSSTADVPGLCAIAVSAAAANASSTAAFLGNASSSSAGGAASGTTTPDEKADYRALLRTCAGKYAAARDALVQARASLAEQDYDYAFVHVSAADEYPAVCRTLFRRRQQQRGGASSSRPPYPPELAKREEALRRLCTIALDIISLLQNQETD